MPTGFTSPIYDGEDITFEQFAKLKYLEVVKHE